MPCSRKVVFRFHELTAEHVGRDSVGRRRALLRSERAAVDVEWAESGRGSLGRRHHERFKLLHGQGVLAELPRGLHIRGAVARPGSRLADVCTDAKPLP